jgi:hypothetical protein
MKWRRQDRQTLLGLAGLTAFFALWLALILSGFVHRALFLRELSRLKATDVDSIQIGKHELRNQQAINEVVTALHQSRWFEVNHGGWGDSVRLTIHRRSRKDMNLDVALYFREPAAIISPAHQPGESYIATEAFVAELPAVLRKYDIDLPDCDTAHGRPCTAAQLNP